tara:strand:- start:110 stop:352 length:243 start_codon:yes stop_codon:yes gene_type:complete
MSNSESSESSYIVRDKRGTYMGGYSFKLGKSNAFAWATECAKQSKGVLYFRSTQEKPEEEVVSYLDFGKKRDLKKQTNNK